MNPNPVILSREVLEKMLDEISEFHIELESDPTRPDLGTKYLQRVLKICRDYLNRISFYLLQSRRYEKFLRNEVKIRELNIDLQLKGLLADDPIVRQQAASPDRIAVATSMLKTEHEELAEMKVDLQNVEETVKLIRAKQEEMNRTNSDIRLQRQMVKDDKIDQMHGGEGYDRPQVNQDRTIPNGMKAPVQTQPIHLEEVLNDNTRPDDLPEPVDGAHANMIADFYSHTPKPTPVEKPELPSEPQEPNTPLAKTISYDSLLD